MGRKSREKTARKLGIKLEEPEARKLLAAQRNEMQAKLAAREAVDLVNQRVKAAIGAKNAVWDGIAKKYRLDPAKPYALDDETLMLTPQRAP